MTLVCPRTIHSKTFRNYIAVSLCVKLRSFSIFYSVPYMSRIGVSEKLEEREIFLSRKNHPYYNLSY